MNKLRLLPLFVLLLCAVTFSACDKDDEETEPTRTDLLTAETWTGTAIYADGQDISADFRDVLGFDITQNTVKFDKAGTYADTYGRQTLSGKWEFANNEQAILFDKNDPDSEYTATITKLEATQLWLQQPVDFEDENGNVQTVQLELRYAR